MGSETSDAATKQTSPTVQGIINVRYDESTSHDSASTDVHKAIKFMRDAKISENIDDRQLNQQNQHNQHNKVNRKSLENEMKPKSNPSNMRKIKKFVRCNKTFHSKLQTTTAKDGKLEIIILKGGILSNSLYIKQHCQYEIRHESDKKQILLASIPTYIKIKKFDFNSIASCTQYIINKKFIRFRNRGVIKTKYVSLWRMYEFEGEWTAFNIWCITKCIKRAICFTFHHNRYCDYNQCVQAPQQHIDDLREDIVKYIFSFLNGSKYHSWIHIEEGIDSSHDRSNLIGLEFDVITRNIYIMQRSPALLKKVREIYKKKNNKNTVLSVEMFKAVY